MTIKLIWLKFILRRRLTNGSHRELNLKKNCKLNILLTMNNEIRNKTLVVTGAAEGSIGFQIAKHYLREQAKLAIIIDINEENGKKAADILCTEFGENKAEFIKCDVTKDQEVTFRLIRNKYSTIDILVNSAGISESTEFIECINVNLTATIQWSLKFLELLNKRGTIINIASIYGYIAAPYCPVYHATKFGVVGFSRSLGHEKNYAKNGVRVIAICPGFTWTNLTKQYRGSEDELHLEVVRNNVWQEAEDVGAKAVEVFQRAESGTVWAIVGGVLREVTNDNV